MDGLDALLMSHDPRWQEIIASVNELMDTLPPEDCTVENIADEIGQSEYIVERALTWLEKAGQAERVD